MIRLNNNNGQVWIKILGYEFPNGKDDWDANWLNIEISILNYSEGIDYKSQDPCILTFELVELREWINSLILNTQNKSELRFMEPNMSFSFINDYLEVSFRYNFNPLIHYGLTSKEELDQTYLINFSKEDIDFKKLLIDIDSALDKFPQKRSSKIDQALLAT